MVELMVELMEKSPILPGKYREVPGRKSREGKNDECIKENA